MPHNIHAKFSFALLMERYSNTCELDPISAECLEMIFLGAVTHNSVFMFVFGRSSSLRLPC